MKKIFPLLFFVSICYSSVFAQYSIFDSIKSNFEIPVSVNYFIHTFKFNMLKSTYIYTHSGVKIGAEYKYFGEKFQLIQSLNAGGFKNQSLIKNYYINTQITGRYITKLSIFGDLSLGVGYEYRQFTGKLLNLFNEENFKYYKPGKSAIMFISGISLGYFIQKTENPTKIFLRYEFALTRDFKNPVSMIPDNFLMIGTIINLSLN